MKSLYWKGAALLSTLVLATLASCGGADSPTTSIVQGDTKTFGSAQMSTWAKIDSAGGVLEAGAIIPLSIIRSMPNAGDGPAGAIATLKYPAAVVAKTFFNTLVVQSNMMGHPGAYYSTPHFDFHFYQVPEATIRSWTALGGDPLSQSPTVSLPAGYVMEPNFVPEMGTHAITQEDMASMDATRVFIKTMIQGYFAGKPIFVEPMVTQELMLSKESFTLPVPRPDRFGLAAPTLYPTKFQADYDAAKDAYIFTYSNFISVQ